MPWHALFSLMGTLRFAYMDVGEGRKLGAVSLAHPTDLPGGPLSQFDGHA